MTAQLILELYVSASDELKRKIKAEHPELFDNLMPQVSYKATWEEIKCNLKIDLLFGYLSQYAGQGFYLDPAIDWAIAQERDTIVAGLIPIQPGTFIPEAAAYIRYGKLCTQ